MKNIFTRWYTLGKLFVDVRLKPAMDRVWEFLKIPEGERDSSLRRHIVAGLIAFGVLVFGLGTWSVAASISGAVIAGGTVVVESNVKQVQHRDGGIVGKILVKDGAYVKVGELLVSLDDTLAKANLAIVRKQLYELEAQQARLEAERDNADEIKFPEPLIAAREDPDVIKAVNGEQTLFIARRAGNAAQIAQLNERGTQLENEVEGLASQQLSKEKESQLIKAQLGKFYQLRKEGLIASPRILELERSSAMLEGQHGELISDIAKSRAQIAEVRQQAAQLEQNRLSDIVDKLREAQGQTGELVEKRIAAEDQLRRLEIRAPQSGFVHELAVHTVGGVVPPGGTIMQIVPKNDSLVVEAHVQPNDIDQIFLGQPAEILFPAFDRRATPELQGNIERISADLEHNPDTKVSYYVVRLRLSGAEKKRLGNKVLVPGMPAEVFFKTGSRSPVSYLIKPLKDQAMRAFREE